MDFRIQFAISLGPVSYTHLDVYKRQALHNAETVWADTDGATNDEHETLLDALTAAGIADERIVATRVEHSTRPTPAKNARERKAIRSKEPAVGVLAPAL